MSFHEKSQNSLSEGLQIPGLVQNQEPIEQLSFVSNPTTPLPTGLTRDPESEPGLSDLDTARQPTTHAGEINPLTPVPGLEPGSTRALLLQSQPAVTQALTGMLSNPGTSSLRSSVVIRGDSNKQKQALRPPQGRRHVIGIAALLLLFFITGGTLFAASPLAHEAGLNFNPLQFGANLFSNHTSSANDLVVQATATAVYHQQNDGFDPGANGGPVVTGSPRSWPLGVCTYWANLRYHQLTGNWVTWTGNAYQWAQGARMAGWNVSQTPHVPSIIVLMPGVQGASGYGHVAVVESASGNTAHTSNMNWYTNGGGWDRVSYYDFTAGSGVYFIWK
ncbi:MAG TPA: CHAP domain-containing protein [Ktedonobacteraceae bacterium]|nr:CHAP domain-containing protein [Ktedonobacteraceae bacterium]